MLEDKKDMKAVNSKSLGSIRAYFMRGHSGWLLYGIWFLSNTAIIFVLLGSQMEWIYQLFPSIVVFGLVFFVSYVVIAVIIGYVDIEIRGIYGAEQDTFWRAVPMFQKLIKAAENITEMKEDIEEVKSILGQLIATVDELLRYRELEENKIGH